MPSAVPTIPARRACLKTHEKDKKNLHPYFTQSGEDREENPDQYIANMRDGSTAGFKYFHFDGPDVLKEISVSIRGTGSGNMEVRTDLNAAPIAEIPIMPSSDWKECAAPVTGKVTGDFPLYFTYRGSGAADFMSLTFISY